MNAVLLATAAAVVGGLITKTVEGWLGARAKVSEELRGDRVRVYPPVWEQTQMLSRWPRTYVTYEDLKNLNEWLRTWYYATGGLYLSEYARERYGEMQELIDLLRCSHTSEPGRQLPDAPHEKVEKTKGKKEDPTPTVYEDLMGACSAFRTALTEDLESRRQRSLLWTVGRWRSHRKLKGQAKKRCERARETAAGKDRVRVPVEPPTTKAREQTPDSASASTRKGASASFGQDHTDPIQ